LTDVPGVRWRLEVAMPPGQGCGFDFQLAGILSICADGAYWFLQRTRVWRRWRTNLEFAELQRSKS